MIIKVHPMQFSKLIICILFFSACSTKSDRDISSNEYAFRNMTIPKDSLLLNTSNGVFLLNDQPYTGTAISRYKNGNNKEIIEYLDGKRHGKFIKYFEHGSISFECFYESGKKHGKCYSWWKNGNLRSETNFKNGIAEGTQKQWYESGAKFKVLYLENGQEKGLQQAWRKNGKLYNNYEAKNGRIFGLKKANLCYELEDEKIKVNN